MDGPIDEQKARPKYLDDVPLKGQFVTHNGKVYDTVKEGLAHILTPEAVKPAKTNCGSQAVFYNPIQQFNRDLSVLAIRAYGQDLQAVREARANQKQERTRNKKKKRRSMPQEKTGCEFANDEDHIVESRGTKRKIEDARSHDETTPTNEIRQLSTSPTCEWLPINGNASKRQELEPPELEGLRGEQRHGHSDGSLPPAQGNDTLRKDTNRKADLRILDALSATGLRALRYAKELPFKTIVTANDLSTEATDLIRMNVRHNKLEDRIHTVTGNALAHMYETVIQNLKRKSSSAPKYDIVDLDPYGTAVPFFDAALQALNEDGGLLCVTCTDAGVWASNGYPEKTYALYGGTPIKGHHSHEAGLRLIIISVATTAARHGLAIEPLLSLSVDFYARIFIRIKKSQAEVKFLAAKTMMVYSCDHGCGAWKTQFIARNDSFEAKDGSTAYKFGMAQGPTCGPFCDHCGRKTHVSRTPNESERYMLIVSEISGPMWGGPLHNSAFILTILEYLPELDKKIYKTAERIEGMLSTALEETLLEGEPSSRAESGATKEENAAHRPAPPTNPKEIDRHPFFIVPSALAKVVRCQAPPAASLRGALKHAGYQVTRSHTKPGSIRTNAPWNFIWSMMREWVRQRAPPIKEGTIKEGTPGWGIMYGQTPAGPQHHSPCTTNSARTDGEEERIGKQQSAGPSGEATAKGSSPKATLPKVFFDDDLGKAPDKKRLLRYQMNPEPNWGPQAKVRAKAYPQPPE